VRDIAVFSGTAHPALAEAVRRIHNGESVSALFQAP
jgi:phosphoribosylpyrophosphate synthetase